MELEAGGTPLLDVVRKVMEADGWPVHQLPDRTVLSTGVAADGFDWSCFAVTFESEAQFAFYSVLPFEIPEDQWLAVSELTTRANYGLRIGNFELDLSDGELRYKTSVDVEGDLLSEAMVRTMLYANISVTKTYLPAVAAVVRFGVAPADAIAQIEGTQ
jgi:hypothetical protein